MPYLNNIVIFTVIYILNNILGMYHGDILITELSVFCILKNFQIFQL